MLLLRFHVLGKSDKPSRTAWVRNVAIPFVPLFCATRAGQGRVNQAVRTTGLAEPNQTMFAAWTLDTSAAFRPSLLASGARQGCICHRPMPLLQKLHKATVAGRATNAPMAFKPMHRAFRASQCRIMLTNLEVDKSITTARTLDGTKACVPCCSTRSA